MMKFPTLIFHCKKCNNFKYFETITIDGKSVWICKLCKTIADKTIKIVENDKPTDKNRIIMKK
jgi:hypothetical protein